VLNEAEQSERLGVSRTPLRETLRQLQAEGLVVPGKGRTQEVSNLSSSEVRHLFELREALETHAARLAARRRSESQIFTALSRRFRSSGSLLVTEDPDRHEYFALISQFDKAIDRAIDSPHLLANLQWVRTHVERARRLSWHKTQRLVYAAQEHALIAEA